MSKYVPKAFADVKGAKIQSNDWWTPPEIFEKLNINFDLDVASPVGGVDWIPAEKYYTKYDDGLKQDWFGTVWCNPPYGRETYKWLSKFINHNNGIALVFARTDTAWFHELVVRADALMFTKGRITFLKSGESSGNSSASGSMLIACGNKSVKAIEQSGLGWFVKL
jgi:phage N-6-adenine-methyltransferase